MAEATKKAELVEVEVTVDNHTHKGQPCAQGDKIKVTADVAKMLRDAWKKRTDAKDAA